MPELKLIRATYHLVPVCDEINGGCFFWDEAYGDYGMNKLQRTMKTLSLLKEDNKEDYGTENQWFSVNGIEREIHDEISSMTFREVIYV